MGQNNIQNFDEALLWQGRNEAGLVLDPRTKLFLLITISVFVLGGAGGNTIMTYIRPVLCAIPFVLMLFSRRFFVAGTYATVYLICYTARQSLSPDMGGMAGFMLLFITDTFCRFLPGFAVGYYVLSSTTVSELAAAMKRMHISDKIIVPLSVMLRFFPTVIEEARSISNAMRMRGVRFGGGKPGKMLEYRLVPLLSCSIKIGEELSAAALVRGLGAPYKRTNISKIGFRVQDIFISLICLFAVIAFALTIAGII